MHPKSVLNGNNSSDDYLPFFFSRLEMNVTLNFVPNGALPHMDRVEENHKLEFWKTCLKL